MQKTLFTLALAASSIAVADVALNDATFSLAGSSITQTSQPGGTGAFSLTITLNQAGLDMFSNYVGSSYEGQGMVLASLTGQSDRTVGVRVGYSTYNSIITQGGLYIEYGGKAPAEAGTYYGGNNFVSSIDWNNVSGLAFTLTFNDITSRTEDNAFLYVTVAHADGSADTTYTIRTSGNGLFWSTNGTDGITGIGNWSSLDLDTRYVGSAYVFDSAVTEANALALNSSAIAATPAVPEPATATLSLLALAGLAARRRRAR